MQGALPAPPGDASIRQLLAEVHLQGLLDQSVDRIRHSIRAATANAWQGKPLNDRQRAVIEEMSDRKADLLRRELNWSELVPAHLEVYRENFTQQDIDATIAFYRSPVGQKMIARQPQIMRQMGEFTLGRMTDPVPQLQAWTGRLPRSSRPRRTTAARPQTGPRLTDRRAHLQNGQGASVRSPKKPPGRPRV